MIDEVKLTAFIAHAKRNGCKIDDDVQFKIDNKEGVGAFFVGEHSIKDKRLIEVPQNFILTKDEALQHFEVAECGSSNPNAITQLYLVALKNEASEKWTPYIQVLPTLKDFNSPLLWQSNELECIRGSDLYLKTKRKLAELLDEWRALLKELQLWSDAAEVFYEEQDRNNIEIGEDYELDSFSAYIWATLIFTSRAFPCILYNPDARPNDAFLLPVVDLLNHKADTTVYWKLENNMVTFSTGADLKNGDEIYNNYGNKSNEDLLLGYGFAYDNNTHDSTSISLKLDVETIENARKAIPTLNCDNISGPSIRFDIAYGNLLPRELVLFFGFISKLLSEDDITTRATLEGLDQLNSIFVKKVAFFKEKSKVMPSQIPNNPVLKLVKTYMTSQRKIFYSCTEEIGKTTKMILKSYSHVSFKSILKTDTSFMNTLTQLLGVNSYEDLVAKNAAQQAVILWIVRFHNAAQINLPLDMSYIKHTFDQVAESIIIEKSDVMEYMDLYKSFFPVLSDKFPEIYNQGSWSIKDFIIAGVVFDRHVWLRKTNREYLFFIRQPFDVQFLS